MRLLPWRKRTAKEAHSLLDGESAETRLLRMFTDPGVLADFTDFDKLAREGYRACAVIRACVDEISSSVSEPRLIVERAKAGGQWEEVVPGTTGPVSPGKQLVELLANPTGDRKTSSTLLRRQILQQDQIFGNSFLRKRRFQGSGRVGALEVLPVPYIEPVRTRKDQKVTQLEYRPEASTTMIVGAPTETISTEDVIHRKDPDPLDYFWGLPRMVSALREIDLDQKAIDYLRSFFINGGTPSGILTLKGQVHPDERSRIKRVWDSNFGSRNRNSTAVLDQDATYQTIGTRPDHLKLGESVFDVSESRVCSVFGVPPIIIGVRLGIIRGTYSNYESARTSFWNETLRPLYSSLDEDLTMQLAWEFGAPGEYRIRHDLANVRDLQESTEILWARANTAYDKGLVTLNEARKIVSLPPTDDEQGDKFKQLKAPQAAGAGNKRSSATLQLVSGE